MDILKRMGLNQTVRFRLYFDGPGAVTAAVMMGAALFFRILYYFGFTYVVDHSGWTLVFDLILPVLLCGGFAVLLKGIRFGVIRVYAILTVVYCVFMMIWTYDPMSIIHFILAIFWYLLTMMVVVSTVEGYIGKRVIMQLAFLLPVLYRFFLFDLGQYVLPLKIVEFLPEASALCGLLALSSFARCLIPERLHHHG